MVNRNGSILENIKLAFKGIFSHKMRSFLTMLGIIIGIASIIAIVSTIKGTNEQIKNNLIGSGTNTITIQPYQGNYAYSFEYSEVPDYLHPVSDETMDSLRKINDAVSVSKYIKREYIDGVYHGDMSFSGGGLYAVDDSYFTTVGYQVCKGRGFTQDDLRYLRKVAILDKTASKSLFNNDDPIGQYIEYKNEIFTVIGVVTQSSQYQPTINNMSDYYTYLSSNTGTIYLPINSWPIVAKFDEPECVVIKAKNTDSMTNVGKKAATVMNEALGLSETEASDSDKIMYKANDLLEQAKQIQNLSSSTNTLLLWIAGISLLVGGIGVMNIMLVSVTERTHEIGLKKAVGARKKRILSQFLTEAAVLTSIGGILGVIVGIVLAYIIKFVASIPVAISTPAILISVVFSAIVGIVFGLLPSIKAANLDPIEALRYE